MVFQFFRSSTTQIAENVFIGLQELIKNIARGTYSQLSLLFLFLFVCFQNIIVPIQKNVADTTVTDIYYRRVIR